MFVWAKINSLDTSSIEFVDNLLYNKEIFITPGSIFGTNGEGYVRLSLCLSQDKLNEALNKLYEDCIIGVGLMGGSLPLIFDQYIKIQKFMALMLT